MNLKSTIGIFGISISFLLWVTIPFVSAQQAPIPVESTKVETAPKVDGDGNDEAWQKAKVAEIQTKDGPKAILKSVYTDKEIFFLITWPDETQSISMDMWEFRDGAWAIKQEPRYGGSQSWDADQDRLAFQWNAHESVAGFNEKGCIVLCHVEEKEDRMHTAGPDQNTDLWQWKAAQTNPLGKMDNGYLDNAVISKKDQPDEEKRLYIAHKWDGDESFVRNLEGDGPKWMSKGGLDKEPFLMKGNEAPFDKRAAKPGDTIPGWILNDLTKGRDVINAKGVYKDGHWTLEIGRALVTDNKKTDVQFEDLKKPYHFGIAIWENDRMFGHMRADGPYMLTFK
jgi:hypothetical protein